MMPAVGVLALQGDFREGDTVRIDASGGDLQFARGERGVAA